MASVPKPQFEAVETQPLHSSVAENFSLVRGGPLYWLQVRLGALREERLWVARRALIAVLVCWLPLLILSLAQSERALPDYPAHLHPG